jgi:hypothetical protein
MTTDSFLSLMLTAMIAQLFGLTLTFLGYRFFLVLLPILGFFFGFGFGAEALQAVVGDGPFATVTSWLVGFFFAVAFAVCSYLFYFGAVAMVSGALGYALGVGLMQAIGFDFGLLTWLVGVVAGIGVAVATLWLNVQKWVVMLATSVLGAGVIVGTFLFLFGGLPASQLVQNPVRAALQTSPFWLIVFLVIAALGTAVQVTTNWHVEVETFNRLSGLSDVEEEPLSEPAGALRPTS